MTTPSGDIRVRSNWDDVVRDLRRFGPKLADASANALRRSGAAIVGAMGSVLSEPPPRGGTRSGSRGGWSRGARAGIRSSLRVTSKPASGRQAVEIKATGDAFALAYNKAEWRHPVRGGARWVVQRGRPYFGSVVLAHTGTVRNDQLDALDDALRVVAKPGITSLTDH